MIPPITDYFNKGTNHSLESNIRLSLRPIVKYILESKSGLDFQLRIQGLDKGTVGSNKRKLLSTTKFSEILSYLPSQKVDINQLRLF